MTTAHDIIHANCSSDVAALKLELEAMRQARNADQQALFRMDQEKRALIVSNTELRETCAYKEGELVRLLARHDATKADVDRLSAMVEELRGQLDGEIEEHGSDLGMMRELLKRCITYMEGSLHPEHSLRRDIRAAMEST